MKKIGYIIIIGFIIASASSIYITLEMGRNFEDFDDDDDGEIEDGSILLVINSKNYEEYLKIELFLSVIDYQYAYKYN